MDYGEIKSVSDAQDIERKCKSLKDPAMLSMG